MEKALPLRETLNLETARITWPELERFFASGKLIHVSSTLDLVEVAACIVEDNALRLQQWMETQEVKHLADDTAKQWVKQQPDNLWAVVVAPWVLVQER